MNILRGVLMAAVVASIGGVACGQGVCGTWTKELAQAGANGPVYAMTSWDPDGPGPEPEWLVIAGGFNGAGGVVTGPVAGWDGTTWHAMGTGVGAVNSNARLVVVGSDLILVGFNSPSLPGTAARYAGGAFVAMDSPEATTAPVADAASSGSELVMVGSFTARPGLNSATIARWRPDTGWTTLGNNVSGAQAVVYHQGDWYISGRPFVNGSPASAVTVLNASGVWEPLTPAGEAPITAAPTQLFSVGGSLWAIGGPGAVNGAGNALRFEAGAWVQHDEGVGAGVTPGRGFAVGGEFYREVTSGGTGGTVYSLIRWGGGSWVDVPGALESRAKAMALYGGQLVAAAQIDGGATPAVSIPGEWRALGSGFVGAPTQATTWRGHAVLGGPITHLDHGLAGGLVERGPNGWKRMDVPLTWADGAYVNITAVASHNNELVVCGGFESGGGVPLDRIAAWNGVSWRSLGAGLPIVPTALVSDGGVLYAAGHTPVGTIDGLFTVWRRVGEAWEQVGGEVTVGNPAYGSYGQELLGVHGDQVAVSSIRLSTRFASGRMYFHYDASGWSPGPQQIGNGVGSYAVLGDSLMISGVASSDIGLSPLNRVTPQGLVARPVGSFWPSTSTPYIFAYRGGLIFSARFLNSQERAVFVPVQGDATAMANPGGVVTAFTEDGVDGYGVVSLDTLGGPANVVVSRISCSCGSADIGSAGGVPGGDGVLNNNDFIVFINQFFDRQWRADFGMAGGLPGADGAFDNNDFIAFINAFFAGCN